MLQFVTTISLNEDTCILGPSVAARVGFEPATFRTQGTELTTEPPRPTLVANAHLEYFVVVH